MAVFLKQELGAGVNVTVCDTADLSGLSGAPVGGIPKRVSALANDGRRFLDRLGVWQNLSSTAQPILEMEITDSTLSDPVRTRLLGLAQEGARDEQIAHMVVNDDLTRALANAALRLGVDLKSGWVDRWTWGAGSRVGEGVARLSDGSERRAHLLIAADGAKSRLREMAGIGWYGRSYDQSAIVATIAHERPHLGKATQHFLPSGPFAILPLTGNRSSIVWSEATVNIPAVLAMDPRDLLLEIRQRFGLERGAVQLEAYPVSAFPLAVGMAQRFHGHGIALVGDSAHLIHPIAGQGLNMGLRDVMNLGEGLAHAVRHGLQVSDEGVLHAYDRRRRSDAIAMVLATDGLNKLFSNDVLPLRLLRGFGARLVERSPMLKRKLMFYASGGQRQSG